MRRSGEVGLVAGLCVAMAVGMAQALPPAEWTIRQKLIDDAQAAHNARDHAKALSLAQQAGALEMTPSLRFFIAREQDEVGALADAYSNAGQCALAAERDPKLRNRSQIIEGCREIERRLKGRVAHVVVAVPNPPEGLKVTLSGHELNQAALGLEYLINPGTVTVEATAPHHSPYRLEISVPEGKTININVTLAPIPQKDASAGDPCPAGLRRGANNECVADDCQIGMARTSDGLHCCWPGQTWDEATTRCVGPVVCPTGLVARADGCASLVEKTSGPPTSGAAAHGGTGTPVAGAGDSSPVRRLAAMAVTAVGAVAVVGGAIAWVVADSEYDALNNQCATDCTQTAYDTGRSKIEDLDRLAVGAWIGGGTLVVGGLFYYFWTGRQGGEERVTFSIDPGRRRLALGWRF